MLECYYKRLIKPINQCSLTGLERLISFENYPTGTVYITLDNYGQHRVWLKDRDTNLVVSAIVIDSEETVRHRYTLPEYRGQHYTHMLYTIACKTLKKHFRLSQYL